jgi:hypothetical protein
MRVFEPSDDWRLRGLDDALEPSDPLTEEEERELYEQEREQRADWRRRGSP